MTGGQADGQVAAETVAQHIDRVGSETGKHQRQVLDIGGQVGSGDRLRPLPGRSTATNSRPALTNGVVRCSKVAAEDPRSCSINTGVPVPLE